MEVNLLPNISYMDMKTTYFIAFSSKISSNLVGCTIKAAQL